MNNTHYLRSSNSICFFVNRGLLCTQFCGTTLSRRRHKSYPPYPLQQIPLQREVVWYLSKIFRKLYPKLDIPIDIPVSLAEGLNRNNVIHDRSQYEFDARIRYVSKTKIHEDPRLKQWLKKWLRNDVRSTKITTFMLQMRFTQFMSRKR